MPRNYEVISCHRVTCRGITARAAPEQLETERYDACRAVMTRDAPGQPEVAPIRPLRPGYNVIPCHRVACCAATTRNRAALCRAAPRQRAPRRYNSGRLTLSRGAPTRAVWRRDRSSRLRQVVELVAFGPAISCQRGMSIGKEKQLDADGRATLRRRGVVKSTIRIPRSDRARSASSSRL